MNLENNYLAPRKWIKNEKKQLEWARNYMDNCTWTGEDEAATGIRHFGNYQNTPYEGIIGALEMKLNSANGIIDLTKMKAAWSQAKYRSKLKSKDKQAYNFVLNTNIKKQLKVLAKQINKPMNETLEDLISSTYEIVLAEKNSQKKLRNEAAPSQNLYKQTPFYFDGIAYYWSDGSYRGPHGEEASNTNRTPYFFNGTHFFWYNGLPRQASRDEIERLKPAIALVPLPGSNEKIPVDIYKEHNPFSPLGKAWPYLRMDFQQPPSSMSGENSVITRGDLLMAEYDRQQLYQRRHFQYPHQYTLLPKLTYSHIPMASPVTHINENHMTSIDPVRSSMQQKWQRRLQRKHWKILLKLRK